MTEEQELDQIQLTGFLAYNAMIGMKYALPIIIFTAISAKFIERVTLVIFKLGGK